MTKSPTETIYDCLDSLFGTQRKCGNCQQQFTPADYQQHNYYLTFQEILNVGTSKDFPEPRDNACLDGVLVRLFHKNCQPVKHSTNNCQVERVESIICK